MPAWFGNPQAVAGYIEQVRPLAFWAALDACGECMGFIAIKQHYARTAEVYVLGVLSEHQRSGIGRELYRTAEDRMLESGCAYALVKTLSDSVDYRPYANTRAFYRAMGFEPIITLTEMWDAQNPCLIMMKPLNAPRRGVDGGFMRRL